MQAATSHSIRVKRMMPIRAAPGSRIFARADALARPGDENFVSRANAARRNRTKRDTDLGLARDRQSSVRKSGKPDLRGPSARSAKHIVALLTQPAVFTLQHGVGDFLDLNLAVLEVTAVDRDRHGAAMVGRGPRRRDADAFEAF